MTLHLAEIPWRLLRTIEPVGAGSPVRKAADFAGHAGALVFMRVIRSGLSGPNRRPPSPSRRMRRADMPPASFVRLVIGWSVALSALLAIALAARWLG